MGTSLGCFSIKSDYCKIKESSWNPPLETSLEGGRSLKGSGFPLVSSQTTVAYSSKAVKAWRVSWSVEEIVKGVYSWATHYLSAHKGGSSVRHILREETMKTERWIQLSFDGAVQINTYCVAA
ncbi:hypothetical protein EPI10_014445 [Gossypium australe]|uniref:Uncharacterized protein n=1 Tax=Gossypium australe TaxID=47621 RepID=A0A5B6VH62_9ROSI|nr:hypothetical protein EPI10_014445 [Gossypium australe]